MSKTTDLKYYEIGEGPKNSLTPESIVDSYGSFDSYKKLYTLSAYNPSGRLMY